MPRLSATRLASTSPSPGPPPYQILRYEEDYSYLRDPTRRTDPWDILKYIRLSKEDDRYLSLGGELRERYEYFRHPRWGQEPETGHGYVLQRYMLHADWHLGPRVRVFGQIKSGLENGRRGGPRPADKDELDLHQAFVDVAMGLGDGPRLTLRAGRQELAFGSQRLVSVREGPNVRQSFDGLRATLRTGSWRVDGFATKPVETNPGIFDDKPDHTRTFWGVYVVRPFPLLPKGNVDLYYLGLDRKRARFDKGTAREIRHSVGTRLWGRPGAVDYNFELVYQWGRFGPGPVRAWTVASDTGYTWRSARWRPRLGLRADIASGDRGRSDPALRTFSALFPKGAYFSEADLIGPANFADLHPALDLHLTERVTFTADWDVFWRESVHDGIYGIAVNLLRSGQTSRARYVGSQPSAQLEWRVGHHMTLTAIYTHFFAGPFLRETRPGQDVNFVTGWVAYKF